MTLDFQCEDCLTYRIGCLESDLPQGVSHDQAATLITEAVRKHRGYALSISGYHTQLNGWLSAAYWSATGVYVLHANRGSGPKQRELDTLIKAMNCGLIKPADAAMLDEHQYATQQAYLSVVPPPTTTSMSALLASSHVSPVWKRGYSKVTLAEFLPVARTLNPPLPAAPTTPVAPKAQPPDGSSEGDVCSVCGDVVRERWLFSSSYIGCRCG